jgi:hypothetical protein
VRTLVAVNTAPESENRMHGDDARNFGFEGGLVPGVDVLAYMVGEAVARWGPEWLGGGRLAGRLLLPVYDGETVEVAGERENTQTEIRARVVGEEGTTRAEARLSRIDDVERDRLAASAAPDLFAESTLPAPRDRPAAAVDRLAPGTVLGTQRAGFHAERAVSYLEEITETQPAFTEHRVAHPGWLLRFANWALSSTVRLGPWIHVASDLALLVPVRDGDQLEVRARVTDRFARKGHEFVDLTALYLVDRTPVALCDHRAIWQPRSS